MGIDTRSFQPEELDPEQLEEMRKDVEDRIVISRIGLLLKHSFFGNMATRLKVKCCDDWCPTAATDGRHLYYNTQFFNALSNKEIEFVIAHEILHCVFGHLIRRQDRDPVLYNIAADYIVNNTLVRDKIGTLPKVVPCYQDFRYLDWTSEEVYDDLESNYSQDQLQQMGALLDEHVDWNDEQDNSSDSNGEGQEGNGRPRYSKEELETIQNEIKENMISASQAAGAGNIPKEIARIIKDLTEPKMNWRQLLQQQIQSTVRSDFTFQRSSRKAWHTGAILPGQDFDDTIDVCIALDTSGSISDRQARDFLSEVKGIMEEYKDYSVKIWCFDTAVYNEKEFTSSNGEDILEYNIVGGGGTDFNCNWEYMKEHGLVPKKFVMFTDGYTWQSWGDENYCDTVFVIHSNKKAEAPFGVTAYYDEKA